MLRHAALFLLALGLSLTGSQAAAQLMRASGPAGPSDSVASRAVEAEAATPEEIERAAYDVEAAPVYYVSDRDAKLRGRIGGGRGVSLPFRDEIRVLAGYDDAFYVEHDGRRGWLDQAEVSNLWIRVDKSDRTVYVYRGAELWQAIPTDVSLNPEDDKMRRSALGEHEQDRKSVV